MTEKAKKAMKYFLTAAMMLLAATVCVETVRAADGIELSCTPATVAGGEGLFRIIAVDGFTKDESFTGARHVEISDFQQAPDGSWGKVNGQILSGSAVTQSILFTNGTSDPITISLNKAGTQSITFTVPNAGGASATFELDPAPPDAGKSSVTQQPVAPALNDTVYPEHFATQPIVTLKDEFENSSGNEEVTASAKDGAWTITSLHNTSSDGSGVATFAGLTASKNGSINDAKITFTCDRGGATFDSDGFNLAAPLMYSISFPNISVAERATKQITPALNPTGAEITAFYASSDETIATVDANGLVTGVKEGTTEITITGQGSDGTGGKTVSYSETCQVTVTSSSGGGSTGGSSFYGSDNTFVDFFEAAAQAAQSEGEPMMTAAAVAEIVRAALSKGISPVVEIPPHLDGAHISLDILRECAAAETGITFKKDGEEIYFSISYIQELLGFEDTAPLVASLDIDPTRFLAVDAEKKPDPIVSLTFKKDKDDFPFALAEKIEGFNKKNSSLIENRTIIGITVNGREILETEQPFAFTTDTSSLSLGFSESKNFTGALFADNGYRQLGGELGKDNKTFTFYSQNAGAFGTFVSDKLTRMIFTVDETEYLLNGEAQANDVAPIISDGRAIMPLRAIAESLGAEVSWSQESETAIITLNEKTVAVTLNRSLPDGMGMPIMQNDRIFVPVRYISEQLGANCVWFSDTRKVNIYM